jgi:hypothetical protein
MVQDIRLAGLDPMGTANSGVATAVPLPTSSWIEITSDVNYDGIIVDNDDFERVKYEIAGSKLIQTNRQLPETLLDNVTNLSFTFLDADDVATSMHSEIRSVVVSITMEKPAGRAGLVSRTYTTTVRCRNL